MKLKPVDFDPFGDGEVKTGRLKLTPVEDNPFVEPMNVDPTEGMSGFDKFAAGMGQRVYDVGRALKQRLGLASQQEIDEAKAMDAPLLKTTEAKIGAVVPDLATLFIPGTAGVKGAAMVGGALNALRPTSEGEDWRVNAALGAALGAGTTYGLQKAIPAIANRVASKEAAGAQQAAQNAVRDANVAAAKEAGYVALPSETGGGAVSQLLEGMSGKIKTQQLAAVKNQSVTDSLVRKAVGLGPEDDLTVASMRAIRAKAYEDGYAPIINWGGGKIRIKPDEILQQEAKAITSRADNAAGAFGDVVKSDVTGLVEGLRKAQPFTPEQGINASAIFREKASDAFASGNKSLGKAYKQAADIVEKQIDRFLTRAGEDGKQVLSDFRAARTLMAKTFEVEKGLNSGQGRFNAAVAGKVLSKQPDRLTDELRLVGMAAQSMPQATRMPQQGWSAPITALDSMGSLAASSIAHNPLPLAIPGARVAARYGLLSRAGQKAIGPSYGPGAIERAIPDFLDREAVKRLGGPLGPLLPSLYGVQQ